MKYLKTYENFNWNFPTVNDEDRKNFYLIFNSLYESHLSLNEKLLIESNYGLINESWFSDLVDKGKRGVLKVASDAGEVLVNLAKKAKDILDFAKQLANQIGEYVKGQFNGLKDKVKNNATQDAGFASVILEFLEKKKPVKLKNYINNTKSLIQYITSGKMITDLVNRLSQTFSKVLNLGTNEGLYYLENEFLFESDENEEKKSFLQRLGEKIMSFPPFSWIPRIEDIMKKGISYVGQMIDKFFGWLEEKTNEAIDLKKSFSSSKFGNAFNFLFQILELYVHYKVIGKIEKFKEILKKASGLEELTNQIKDKSLSEVWTTCGLNPDEITNNFKSAIKKIPYVGDILSVIDSLVTAVGIYLAVEPTLKKLTT
jgi:hypothetical protein